MSLLYIKCSEKLKKKICDIGFGNVFKKVNSFTLLRSGNRIITPFSFSLNQPFFQYSPYDPFFPYNPLKNKINFNFYPFPAYNYHKIK